MYWAVVVLATLVFFLAAAVVVYLIRDARHKGQAEILRHVQSETQEVRALCLELHQAKQDLEAAQMAEAAKRGEDVLFALPSKIRNNSVREERKAINSFSNPNYRPELNPFENGASESPVPSTSAEKRQPQQQQPEAVVVIADVHAKPNRPQQQQQPPEEVVVVAEVHAKQTRRKQQQHQPEIVVVGEVVPQQQLEAKEMPKFSSNLNGIRSKLEHLFEHRPLQQPQPVVADAQQQQQHQPEAVAVTKPQPVVAVVDKQQEHQHLAVAKPEKEIIYASLVFRPPQGPKRELVAASPCQTATIKRPSTKPRKAPPPPSFSKPELPFAGVAKGGTLPRPQKPPPPPPTNVASNQAASSVTLNQASRKAAPPPPRRRSSLRSLNSLRRSRSTLMKLDSKIDLPTKFLNDYDLWDEDEQFVTYV